MKITIDNLVDVQAGPFKFVNPSRCDISDPRSLHSDLARYLQKLPDRLIVDLERTPKSKYGDYRLTFYIDVPTFERKC